MTDDLEDVFKGQMVSAGWEPVRDVFGGLYSWWKAKEDRRVNHTRAFHYWKLTGNLPVDSLNVGKHQYVILFEYLGKDMIIVGKNAIRLGDILEEEE